MNILITGGCGHIGSHLVVPLITRGDRVTLFDLHRKPIRESNALGHCELVEGNLSVEEDVVRAMAKRQYDIVFHLGAILSAKAEENPEMAIAVNFNGTFHVLEAARKHGVKKVVFASTAATYGIGLPDSVPLDTPQWPITIYGVTKVAGERLGVYYQHRHGLDFRAVRFPALVGPFRPMGGASAYTSRLFDEAVFHGRYEFYVNPSTRISILYMADAVQALLGLADAPKEKLRQLAYTLHGLNPSAKEMAAAVKKHLPDVIFTYKPDPVLTPMVESWPKHLDDSAARRDWGWRPSYDLAMITQEMIQILQANPRGK